MKKPPAKSTVGIHDSPPRNLVVTEAETKVGARVKAALKRTPRRSAPASLARPPAF